ncbi:hypothetical protein [Oligoflexus tunisiensis]|uniref:hypothetical protein n=1 Tax=Oligoflexus tunisiensis TaxID=708132 RepID=UPI00114CDE39|nr:hypothetical protein [Oligoflexus tunisiensis]
MTFLIPLAILVCPALSLAKESKVSGQEFKSSPAPQENNGIGFGFNGGNSSTFGLNIHHDYNLSQHDIGFPQIHIQFSRALTGYEVDGSHQKVAHISAIHDRLAVNLRFAFNGGFHIEAGGGYSSSLF